MSIAFLNQRRITQLSQNIAESLIQGDVCGCFGQAEYLKKLNPDHPALSAYRAHLAISRGELPRAVSFIFNVPLEKEYNLAWAATIAAQEAYVGGAMSFNEMTQFIGALTEIRPDVYYDYGKFLSGKVLKKIDENKEFDPDDSDLIFMHFFDTEQVVYTMRTAWEERAVFDKYFRQHLGGESGFLDECLAEESEKKFRPHKRILKSVMTCEPDGDAA